MLIGSVVLMETVQGLQAVQLAEVRRARARRCLERLRRLAPLVDRWSLFVRQLHTEVSYRPGGQGAKRCRDEFEALAAGGALHAMHAPDRRWAGAAPVRGLVGFR